MERIYDHFDTHVKTGLLVFDNVESFSPPRGFGVYPYLPRSQGLENSPLILMTCRTEEVIQKYIPQDKIIPLEALSEEEALALMRFSLRLSEAWYQEVKDDLVELNKFLEGYPLALEVAISDIDGDVDEVQDLKFELRKYIDSLSSPKMEFKDQDRKDGVPTVSTHITLTPYGPRP